MTRAQLLKLVAHLNWSRDPVLRTPHGDCPIRAAYRIKYPGSRKTNADWERMARALGLSKRVASQIILEADAYSYCKIDKELRLPSTL